MDFAFGLSVLFCPPLECDEAFWALRRKAALHSSGRLNRDVSCPMLSDSSELLADEIEYDPDESMSSSFSDGKPFSFATIESLRSRPNTSR
jgi:hypothetical protein